MRDLHQGFAREGEFPRSQCGHLGGIGCNQFDLRVERKFSTVLCNRAAAWFKVVASSNSSPGVIRSQFSCSNEDELKMQVSGVSSS